jgi:hypothetical protein
MYAELQVGAGEVRFNCPHAYEEPGSDFPSRQTLGRKSYHVSFTSGQDCGPFVHLMVRAAIHLKAPWICVNRMVNYSEDYPSPTDCQDGSDSVFALRLG